MGLIHIICGNGKGKTTAAIGLSIRAVGRGRKVLIARFLKDNDSGELPVLATIPGIDLVPITKEFGFTWKMSNDVRQKAKEYYSEYLIRVLTKAKEEEYDLLILDEMLAAYNYEFIDREYLVDFLTHKPEGIEVVMTGRNPSSELVELADYVSEIQKVKHPFDVGIPAREGIEY